MQEAFELPSNTWWKNRRLERRLLSLWGGCTVKPSEEELLDYETLGFITWRWNWNWKLLSWSGLPPLSPSSQVGQWPPLAVKLDKVSMLKCIWEQLQNWQQWWMHTQDFPDWYSRATAPDVTPLMLPICLCIEDLMATLVHPVICFYEKNKVLIDRHHSLHH